MARNWIARNVVPRQINVLRALFPELMTRTWGVSILLSLACVAAFAGAMDAVRIAPSATDRQTIDVAVENGSLEAVLATLELYTGKAIRSLLPADRQISLHARSVRPLDALRRIAAEANLKVDETPNAFLVSDPSEPRLALDVKDAEVHEIMKIVKQQCGIRNLIIDPDVSGKGTFLFKDVPCSVGLRTIVRSLELALEIDENSTVVVNRSRR